MLDHSDEELHGPVEELVLRRFLLEVDHEILDSQGVLLLSSGLSTVPLMFMFTIFSLCFFSTLTIPWMSVDCLLRIAQLNFMLLWGHTTIVHHNTSSIALWFFLRTIDLPLEWLKLDWPFTSLRVDLLRRSSWFSWNFIFIADWRCLWYLRSRRCALLEGCCCCFIFDFGQLLHPLLFCDWRQRVGLM